MKRQFLLLVPIPQKIIPQFHWLVGQTPYVILLVYNTHCALTSLQPLMIITPAADNIHAI